MKKYVLFLLFFVFASKVISARTGLLTGNGPQATRIFLISPKNNVGDYLLVNKTDTAYIELDHSEDMGVTGGPDFFFKKNVPDGAYEVYIDDTINCKGWMKDGMKDSLWTYFHNNGTIFYKVFYKEDRYNGNYIEYDENGSVRCNGFFIDDKTQGALVYFYPSGKPSAKEYFEIGRLIRREEFSESGELIEAGSQKKDSVTIKPGKSNYKVSQEIKTAYTATSAKWLLADGRCSGSAPLPIIYKKTKDGYIKWDKSPQQLDCGAGTVQTSHSYNFSFYIDEPGTYKIAFEEYYLTGNKTKLWFSGEFTVK
jgi:hypothetical protein